MQSGRAGRTFGLVAGTGFAGRLDAACESSGLIPAHNRGRQTWLRRHLASDFDIRVSGEAVSKWFAGEAIPRLATLKCIAQLLGTDWATLLDTSATRPEHSPRAELDAVIDEAVNGRTTILRRGGQAQAVVVAFDEWQRLSAVPSFGRLLMSAPIDPGNLPPRSTSAMRTIDL